MKHTKTWGTFLTVLLAAVVFSGTSFADFDVQKMVDDFNGLNSGRSLTGLYFKYPDDDPKRSDYPYAVKLTIPNGYNNFDMDAYVAGGTGSSTGTRYFNSFCVEPNERDGLRDSNNKIGQVLVGTLHYDAASGTSKTDEGKALTMGAAILYKMYVTGEIKFSTTADDAEKEKLRDTIRGFMSVMYTDPNSRKTTNYYEKFIQNTAAWSNNRFLMQLLNAVQASGIPAGMTAQEYLMSSYDPGQSYDLMGDYSVFVMRTTSTDGKIASQDFLILLEHEGSPDVPEPATLLLWTLGGLGAAGTSWARKRRLAKAA
jgi:PEP-CTERM putative exosortase interaction domain